MRGKEKGFSVSVHFKFDLEEISLESNNFHRRVFYIGQSAVKTNNGVQITVLNHPTKIEEEVHEKYSAYAQDCVIDSKSLKQIYPSVDKFEDSELAKWIKQIESMKYNIQKVK